MGAHGKCWTLLAVALAVPALALLTLGSASTSLDPVATATSTAVPPTATSTAVPTATATPTATVTPTATATSAATATSTPTRKPTPAPPPARGDLAPTGAWPLILGGGPQTGLVALTFDAGGRDPGGTAHVLDALKQHGAHSTFFLTGEWSEVNPDLVRRMAVEGHELANHTYDHPHLPQLSDQEMLSQLARTEQVVKKIAGVDLVKYVRPPFGDYDHHTLDVLGSHGYGVVYWTLDSADWRTEVSAQEVENRVSTKSVAGDVVVAHCYAPKTSLAIQGTLERLKARGLRFGTLSQVLGR